MTEQKNDLKVTNFHCSKHGAIKPVPKCPECHTPVSEPTPPPDYRPEAVLDRVLTKVGVIPTPPPTEWEKEFEKLMPKRADESMSYSQFCAVRNFIRTLLAEQKARMVEVVEDYRRTKTLTLRTKEFEILNDIIKALSR